MTTVVNSTLSAAMSPSLSSSILPLLVGALGVLIVLSNQLFKRTDENGIPYKAGLPFIGSWTFFSQRHAFSHEGLRKFGQMFTFNVHNHKILMVSGEDSRKTFFGTKNLDFTEGYNILLGTVPTLEEINVKVDRDPGDVSWFGKRLIAILRRDRLEKTLPLMLQDLDRSMKRLGTSGTIDPTEDIYQMVFQLTMRAASCRELADDPKVVDRLATLYWTIESNTTPSSILLPWLPIAARKRRLNATSELYTTLKAPLEKRKKEGLVDTDAAQVFLDEGDTVDETVQFIMGAVFAGVINTGVMSSWLTLYLGTNPEWKNKVLAETRTFIAKYVKPGSTASLSEQLAQVPPQVWEDEMSVLDICLRETIRIVMTGSALRRALPNADGEPDIAFGGKMVKPGTFLAYPVTTVHLDPSIYPDPEKWDPERHLRGEDKKEQWAFLGWGVGRHPCLGMRFAKLEVKIIITLLLMQYDYEVVDASGNPIERVPEPDRSEPNRVRPVKPVYIKYTRVTA